MRIAEYGRSVQKMIDKLKEISDRAERTKAAYNVVHVMTLLNPSVRDLADYKNKLWDHLFMIAEFDLDVDSPYPMPDPDELAAKPLKPKYPSNHIQYRFYGRIVEEMIKKGMEMEEGPARDGFLNTLASYMKMSYRNWNEDKVPDEIIIKHIRELSKGKLVLEGFTELSAHAEVQPQKGGPGHKRDNRGSFRNRGGNKRNFRKN